MSRTFYILAGIMGLFAVLCLLMALIPSGGLPASASIWRTVGLFLLFGGLCCALLGIISHLFEQVDHRSQQARLAARRKRRENQSDQTR